MYVRKFSIAFACLVCLLLSGCGRHSGNIYITCREVNNVKYCYNQNGEFFMIAEDGRVTQYTQKDLKPHPMIHIEPTEGDYNFTYVLPGLYSGTLESLNNYLGALSKDCKFVIKSCDWNSVELYAYSDAYSVRILFNLNGELRIYAIDNSDKPISAPYLLERG